MIAVIGDVHGCFYTLKQLVDKIRTKYPSISIYCVGDLVDGVIIVLRSSILYSPKKFHLLKAITI